MLWFPKKSDDKMCSDYDYYEKKWFFVLKFFECYFENCLIAILEIDVE